MCRAIFSYELGDPDFSWLLSTFQEAHPNYFMVDSTCLPLVLIQMGIGAVQVDSESSAGIEGKASAAAKDFVEK
ncbi:MAG: hypothetical protein EBZ48_05440 [Proteobacteria bacterium]|nr:hypothetical protein [Pseudomonadota bacterium]